MARISTTVNSSHVLIVEAEGDRGFFEQVCKSLQLNPDIKVSRPKDYQIDYENILRDGKQGALKLLDNLLPELLDNEAPTKRLAIIIDADYESEQGLGCQKTIEQVCERVKAFGFFPEQNQTFGLSFKHRDGVAEFGLWVLPNNQKEGELEDFIKECIANDEQLWFRHAVEVIDGVPNPKFGSNDRIKAQVNTWLAWQKPPGHGLYFSVRNNLLDTHHPLFKEMQDWLKQIFT